MIHLGDLPNWEGARRVAVDIETRDPDLTTLGPAVRRGGYITGVAFSVDYYARGIGEAYYLPMRHEGGGNYDPDQVLAYLMHQAERFRGELVGANLPYDLDYLLQEGVRFHPSHYRDVLVAGALLSRPEISPSGAELFQPMNLDAVGTRLGLAGKDEAGLARWAEDHGLDRKADMWRAPAHIVADYAKQDVQLPLQILKRQCLEIDKQDMWRVFDLESELLPTLVDMRRLGVRVDMDKVDQCESLALKHERAAAKTITERSGIPFDMGDINKAAVLAKHLEADGVKCPLTNKTKAPSITTAWLNELTTPVAEAIKDARKWNKVRGTFCTSIRRHAIHHGDHWRVHCTFNQLRQEREDGSTKGVGFGRLSSSCPNLQQQPARDPVIGPLWRSIYLPDDGGQWACLDFSSQEPRWITHFAETVATMDYGSSPHPWNESTRAAAIAAAEACRTNPHWDNHSMMAGMVFGKEYSQAAYEAGDKRAKELRSFAKQIFLGLCYGMGGGKLCDQLGLESELVKVDWSPVPVRMAGPEGQALLDRFDAGVPYVRALARLARVRAQRVGEVVTPLGRRCRFPKEPNAAGYGWAFKALNRLIQGTAADQTKLAMVHAARAGFRMQLQVHDEVDLTIHHPDEAKQLADIMVNALPAVVPTRVDIETGPDWGHIAA